MITPTAPKTGKTTTYYWCPHHVYDVVHKPEDCHTKGAANSKPAAQANVAVVQDAVCNALEALQADE
jgi:hypothetical protein